jgi:hypothetical protein
MARDHQLELNALQKTLQDKRCLLEEIQLTEREKAETKALQKQHHQRAKAHPKLIKLNEQRMKKAYADSVRNQEKLFKTAASLDVNKAMSRTEKDTTLKRNKADQAKQLAELEQQFKNSVAEMTESHIDQMEKLMKSEVDTLAHEQIILRKQVEEYQATRLKALTDRLNKDTAETERVIGVWLSELENFKNAERFRIETEHSRLTQLDVQHELEIQTFNETPASMMRIARTFSDAK